MNHLKSCGFKRGAVFLGLIVLTAVVAFPVSFGGCDETDEGSSPEMGPGPRAAFISSVQGDAGSDYSFAKVDGRALAVNPAKGFRTEIAGGALHVEPDGNNSSWSLQMRWSGIGRGERIEPVDAPLDNAEIEGNRATYHRRDVGEEWYLNGPLGIEQGFAIDTRPEGDTGEIVLQVTVAGLDPVLSGNGREVSLHSANGEKVLRYTDLYALDADGTTLDTFMSVSDEAILLHVDDEDARYPIIVDPLVWCETKKLMASDAEAEDAFGNSVAISGDTAMVGAMYETAGGSNAGAAYVFYRDQGGADNWGEVKKLIASDAEADDYFGITISISGDTAVIGANWEDTGGSEAGAAYVFQRDEGGADNWGEVKKLTASDAEADDRFGVSVYISGDTAVIGANGEDTGASNAGAVFIFERDYGGTDNWGEVKKLTASDAEEYDNFGGSVAIGGDTIIVGANGEDTGGSHAGAAYVFYRDQGGADNWGEVEKLTASDAEADDWFGRSVAIGGDTVVVGAYDEDAGGSSAGAAYVFQRDQGGTDNWGEVKKLTASDAEADDLFGVSVSISSDTAIVGAVYEDAEGSNAGAAYVFERDHGGADNWGEVKKLTASDAQVDDGFGWSVSISGDTAVAGAFGEDTGGSYAGAAYVFAHIDIACTAPSDCASGFCVDGVCCDTDCGGNVTTDCQACSIAQGAALDGVCEDLTGTVCDDALFCNGIETCTTGVCGSSTGDPCSGPDGDGDCAESCDETADDCTENDPDGSDCDDGDSTTIDDQCTSGVCEGTASDTDTDTDADAGTSGGDSGGCGCRAVGTAGSDAGLLDLLMAII